MSGYCQRKDKMPAIPGNSRREVGSSRSNTRVSSNDGSDGDHLPLSTPEIVGGRAPSHLRGSKVKLLASCQDTPDRRRGIFRLERARLTCCVAIDHAWLLVAPWSKKRVSMSATCCGASTSTE